MTAPVVVLGATGRMGRLVVPALRRAGFSNVAGVARSANGALELDDGPVALAHDVVAALEPGGVVVDFSSPETLPLLLQAVRERQARLVVGTTGQTAEEMESLRNAAQRTAVVYARNFSLGINRLAQCLAKLRVLAAEGFDVECIEAHHRQKRDAPSGTAFLLLEALLGSAPAHAVHGRQGRDLVRRDEEVGVHSLRLGQIAGERTVLLAGAHEVVEIRHRALDRAAFVSGVPAAVRFVQSRDPGFYSLEDVMG